MGGAFMRRLLLSFLILALAAFSKEPPKAELNLKDATGQKVSLRDLRGKIVVLNFWATWCGPCNEEMPMIVDIEKEYHDRGVAFIAASLDDAKTRSQIPAFVSKYQIGFPVWYGATGEDLAKLNLGEAVPDTVFIDQEGRIVARVMGQMRKNELKERLDWLTGDRTSPAPQPVVKHLEK
jgi:thiol-disulfide isomerase/thioredoxin